MKKIIITDAVDKKSVAVFESAGFAVTYKPGMPPDEIEKVIGEYNGMVVRSDTQVTPKLIGLMTNMEVIGRAGSGVDNIDVDAATKKGIIVMNTPGGNTISTAEHTMALLLSMCRNIPQANISLKNKKWDRKTFKGTELHSKTLGIIGLGKIGREVAYRAQSFGMNVIGYDPVLSDEVASKINVELVQLEELFKRSDIISVHVPMNEQTENLICEKTIALCKDGVKLINCARGGIINEADLIKALDAGKVSAAAFDVYVNEPPDFSSRLFEHPKVVCTPHLGASTEEAQEKVAVQIAEQIVDMFTGKPVSGAVNASSIKGIENKEIAPFVTLAEKLGMIHAQLLSGQLKQISINLSGELLQSYSSLITTAVLKGFLSKKITDTVNLINSPYLIKQMGIVINETRSGANINYKNLVTVEFETEVEKKSVSGTVFGNNEIRVVKIDSYHLELKPEGFMIFYKNIDKPGMLATVGRVLADANLNIAGLSLGRLEAGKEALTVINLDSEASSEVLTQISSINGIENVRTVRI